MWSASVCWVHASDPGDNALPSLSAGEDRQPWPSQRLLSDAQAVIGIVMRAIPELCGALLYGRARGNNAQATHLECDPSPIAREQFEAINCMIRATQPRLDLVYTNIGKGLTSLSRHYARGVSVAVSGLINWICLGIFISHTHFDTTACMPSGSVSHRLSKSVTRFLLGLRPSICRSVSVLQKVFAGVSRLVLPCVSPCTAIQ